MNDKRRLNRVQWTKGASAEGAQPIESSPTPWAIPPAEESASSWQAAPMANAPAAWSAGTAGSGFAGQAGFFPQASNLGGTPPWNDAQSGESNASSWNAGSAEGNYPAWGAERAPGASVPWAMSSGESDAYQEGEIPAEASSGENAYNEAYDPAEYDPQAEGFYPDEMYEEGMYEDEEAFLEQQRQVEEAERRTLRDALLILVALYIICGVAPLFMGLFVPLRIFFWLEIGGWVIILAWLIIGVRRPLMRWFRERARKRAEEAEGEQIAS